MPPTRFATGANEQAAGNKKMPSLNGCRLAARACAGCFIPNPSGSSTRVKLRNGVRRRCVSLFTDRVWLSHVSHNTARLAEQATWTSGRGEEREPECEKKEKKKLQGRLKKRLFARFSTARRFVPSAVASRACRIGLKGHRPRTWRSSCGTETVMRRKKHVPSRRRRGTVRTARTSRVSERSGSRCAPVGSSRRERVSGEKVFLATGARDNS